MSGVVFPDFPFRTAYCVRNTVQIDPNSNTAAVDTGRSLYTYLRMRTRKRGEIDFQRSRARRTFVGNERRTGPLPRSGADRFSVFRHIDPIRFNPCSPGTGKTPERRTRRSPKRAFFFFRRTYDSSICWDAKSMHSFCFWPLLLAGMSIGPCQHSRIDEKILKTRVTSVQYPFELHVCVHRTSTALFPRRSGR